MFKKYAAALISMALSFGVHAKMHEKSNAALIALAKQYSTTADELAYDQDDATCFGYLEDGAVALDAIVQLLDLAGRAEGKMWAKSARSAIHFVVLSGCERVDDIRRLDAKLGLYQAEF